MDVVVSPPRRVGGFRDSGPVVIGHVGLADTAVGIIVLGWLLRRQLTTRPVRERHTLAVVLLIVGLVQTVASLHQQPLPAAAVMSLLLSLLLGSLLSVVRAFTMRVFVLDGTPMRRGTALTALLWLATVLVHLALAHTGPQAVRGASLVAYIGYSLLAQQFTLWIRTRHLRSPVGPTAADALGWTNPHR